nr:hypothetical protein [Tanacetum cinerariifolium]
MDQNIDFSGSDQIQTSQYPEIQLPSQETSDEVFQDNESFKNPSNEIAVSNSNQEKEEPPQDSDMHLLIKECSTEIHAIAPDLSTKEPEHLLSLGYEHLSITPEIESDEVTESNAENLLPIPSECEVTLEDKREYVVLREKLLSITRLISNIESLNDNPNPDHVLNSFESVNSLSDNFLPEFKTFCNHTKETRRGNTTHADNSLPEYDSFCFEIEPDQEMLINLDNPLIPRPPLEPPDAETDAGEEIPVVINDKDEDVDYSSFIFVMFDK